MKLTDSIDKALNNRQRIPPPQSDAPFQVGDVIQLKGAGVAKELEPTFWRVRTVAEGGVAPVTLDGPYVDAACVTRFHSGLFRK